MNNKIYYLSTCDTCKKILKELDLNTNHFELVDIKITAPTEKQIDELKKNVGSYEALFSKRAQRYKELGLAQKQLTEEEYKKYLLQHYTFLKRPVIVYDGKTYIGSDQKTMQQLKTLLKK